MKAIKNKMPRCEQCQFSLSYDCGNKNYVCQGPEHHRMDYDRFHDLRGTPIKQRKTVTQ